MTEIIMDNAMSMVQTDSESLAQLRHRVSYQERMLPPRHIQEIIKRHYAENPKKYWQPLKQLMGSKYAGTLWSLGWGSNRLTEGQVIEIRRNPGFWDGWVRQVSEGGYFGSGLVPMVERVLRVHMGHQVNVIDRRQVPELDPNTRSFNLPPMWDHQREAFNAFFQSGGRGVMDIPPRCGKTRIAVAIVMALGLPTLVVVPTKALVTQTVDSFREWFPEHQVVGITGGKPSMKKQRAVNRALVWVATPGTAAGPRSKAIGKAKPPRQGMQGIETRRVLVVDEFHHSAAKTWQAISMAARNAYYRLGLTGTHYRADGKDLAMHAVLSRCIYAKTIGEMVAIGRLVPAKVAMIRVTGDVAGQGYAVYADGVAGHDHRNALVAWAAQQLMAAGRRVLVLTKEVAHSRELAEAIGFGALQVDGAGQDSAAQVKAAVGALGVGHTRCVVGTSVIGEGVDAPTADALVYAAGGRSKVKHVQDYFRVLTAQDGKSSGLIVDFADNHNPKLMEAAAHRLGQYRAQSAFDSVVLDPNDFFGWVQQAA